jgi:hypothetical protein
MGDPKVADGVERARSRGHKVEIDPKPPRRTIIYFAASPRARSPKLRARVREVGDEVRMMTEEGNENGYETTSHQPFTHSSG